MPRPGTQATTWRLFTSIVFVLAMLGAFAPATLAAGVCPATKSDLQSLISAGGTIILDCSVDTTIPFSSHITISNSVTLDASGSAGTITLDGGGQTHLFYVDSGASLTLDSLTITRGSHPEGGAIDNHGTLTVRGSTFDGNGTLYGSGGAIYTAGTLNIDTSTFSDNATWTGGAIFNIDGLVIIDRSIFEGNGAQEGGGIITHGSNPGVELSVSNSTFTNNTGLSAGSAVDVYNTPTTIRNSTFAGNGGNSTIYLANAAPLTLLNNTFSANKPAGVAIMADGSTLTEGGNIYDTVYACFASSIVDLGYNLDPIGSCTGHLSGTGDVGGNPMLDTLAENGGPTQTVALLSGSPALDRIPTSYTYVDANGDTVPLCPSTDQRGITRPSGSRAFCDAGAFESDLTSIPADTTSPVITPNISGALGNNGWYKSDVTVSWSVADAESDIASSSGCDSTTINSDTAGTVLACTATSVGGTNTQSVTIKRDATEPTIGGAPTTQPNSNGWYNDPVTIHWTCGDATAGIASCPADTVISTDGANQTVSGTTTDNAGNTTTAASPAVNIDTVLPTVTYSGNQGTYTVDQTVNISCGAADQPELSGLAASTCADINQPAADLGVGSHTFSATATDNAGNSETGSVTFTVQVTTDSLNTLTEQYASKDAAAKALSAPLKLAQRAEQMHNDHLKDVAVKLYIRLVNHFEGRGLSAQQVATLTQLAQDL